MSRITKCKKQKAEEKTLITGKESNYQNIL